ncbi:MAG: PCRF domain-containing protein, partial [Gemmatimonadota bacterium]
MGEPKFWEMPDRAREVIQEVNTLKNWIEPFDKLEAKLREMTELDQLLNTEHDPELSDELDRELAAFDGQLTSFELRSMLQGPDDHRNAMVEISAGAGGTEAQD